MWTGSEPCHGDGKSLVPETARDSLEVVEIGVRAEHGNDFIAWAGNLKYRQTYGLLVQRATFLAACDDERHVTPVDQRDVAVMCGRPEQGKREFERRVHVPQEPKPFQPGQVHILKPVEKLRVPMLMATQMRRNLAVTAHPILVAA